MSPVRAILFDRDGVLTRFDMNAIQQQLVPLLPVPLTRVADAWRIWCETHACPTTIAEESLFWSSFWAHIALEMSMSAETHAALEKFDYTKVLLPHDDARDALAFTKGRGMRVGVLSNFPLASIDQSLHAVGLRDLIDVAFSATTIGHAKPSPRSYELALEALQVRADECLFFDDEIECVEGARAIGMTAYWVDRRLGRSVVNGFVVGGLDVIPTLVQTTT